MISSDLRAEFEACLSRDANELPLTAKWDEDYREQGESELWVLPRDQARVSGNICPDSANQGHSSAPPR